MTDARSGICTKAPSQSLDLVHRASRQGPSRAPPGILQLATAMLRQATTGDIAGIQHVRRSVRENRLVATVISDDDVRRAIEESGRGWVVESDDEVVGFAIGNAATGNIWALFVHPEHERRGYGRQLHDAMVAWLWSRGLDELWLTTEPGTRAQRFYEAAGWLLVGPTAGGEVRYELHRETP